jgi:hypothetical protein
MPTGVKISADYAQAITPDHSAQMGSSGADVTVPNGSAGNSDAAPARGMVIVSIPSGLTVRLRIGTSATADATDQAYFGPAVWHFPILSGERVSLYGVGATGTATVSMAR